MQKSYLLAALRQNFKISDVAANVIEYPLRRRYSATMQKVAAFKPPACPFLGIGLVNAILRAGPA